MADEEADLGSPSGSASPDPGVGARRVAEILSEAECMELLAHFIRVTPTHIWGGRARHA